MSHDKALYKSTYTLLFTLRGCGLLFTDGVAGFASLGQSVAVVSPSKTAELIEMLFGMWTRVGLKKHTLDGVHIGR